MAEVLCDRFSCQHLFEVPSYQVGRFGSCPQCGHPQSLRPAVVQTQLRQRSGASNGHPSPSPRIPLVGVLDDIRSRWNVGSMFRTADGLGLEMLVLCGITAAPPDAQIAKTALRADEMVPWKYYADVLEACSWLKQQGYQIVVLESEKNALPFTDFTPDSACAFVVGNEVVGVHPEIIRQADQVLKLPMYGHKISYNVAVAFGICAATLSQNYRASTG